MTFWTGRNDTNLTSIRKNKMPHFSLKSTHKQYHGCCFSESLWSSLFFFFFSSNNKHCLFIYPALLLLSSHPSTPVCLSFIPPLCGPSVEHSSALTTCTADFSTSCLVTAITHTLIHTRTQTRAHTHIQHLTYSVHSKRVLKCLFLFKKTVGSLKSYHLYKKYLFWSSRMRKTPCISVVSTSSIQEKTITLCLALRQDWIQCWRLREWAGGLRGQGMDQSLTPCILLWKDKG